MGSVSPPLLLLIRGHASSSLTTHSSSSLNLSSLPCYHYSQVCQRYSAPSHPYASQPLPCGPASRPAVAACHHHVSRFTRNSSFHIEPLQHRPPPVFQTIHTRSHIVLIYVTWLHVHCDSSHARPSRPLLSIPHHSALCQLVTSPHQPDVHCSKSCSFLNTPDQSLVPKVLLTVFQTIAPSNLFLASEPRPRFASTVIAGATGTVASLLSSQRKRSPRFPLFPQSWQAASAAVSPPTGEVC